MTDYHENEPDGSRGRPFPPGTSGNAAGRPTGSRNRTSVVTQALMDGAAEGLLDKALEMARGGDRTMLALLLKPILRGQGRPITLDLPEIRTAADAANFMKALLKQVFCGELTLDEAEQGKTLVQTFLQAIEAADFEKRVRVLEQIFFDQTEEFK